MIGLVGQILTYRGYSGPKVCFHVVDGKRALAGSQGSLFSLNGDYGVITEPAWLSVFIYDLKPLVSDSLSNVRELTD